MAQALASTDNHINYLLEKKKVPLLVDGLLYTHRLHYLVWYMLDVLYCVKQVQCCCWARFLIY